MKWIRFEDKKPEINQRILVAKYRSMGGYYPGVYIAYFAKPYFNNKETIIIDDMEKNSNNYRHVEQEFSHWMPLPKLPEDLPSDPAFDLKDPRCIIKSCSDGLLSSKK